MPRQRTWDREAVIAFAATQYSLITARQLQAFRVPSSTVSRSNEFGGMFSLVLPDVHRVDGHGPLSVDQRDKATLLYTGAGSALTGRSALLRMRIEAAKNDAFGTDVHVRSGMVGDDHASASPRSNGRPGLLHALPAASQPHPPPSSTSSARRFEADPVYLPQGWRCVVVGTAARADRNESPEISRRSR